jgi:transcription elongation factor GreA
MSQLPITPQGFEKLNKELEHLISIVRPQVINELAEARAHGDLSENAEYDAAKERQGMVEARIRFLKLRLQQYQIVDPQTLEGNKITFGAIVSIIDCETEKEETWQIVGEDEADLKEKRISVSSPIGRALIGKEVGDSVEIRTPKGIRACEITRLRFS